MERFLKNIPQNFNIPNSSTEKDLPISLEKVLPLDTSREFIPPGMISGGPSFADGEGCFLVFTNETYVTLTFVIELHRDDIDILYKIVKNLGIGWVIKSKNRNSAKFYVNKFYDIVKVLIPIFQEFTLQTTKYLDFICFLKVALIKLNVSPSFSGNILSIMEKEKGAYHN